MEGNKTSQICFVLQTGSKENMNIFTNPKFYLLFCNDVKVTVESVVIAIYLRYGVLIW